MAQNRVIFQIDPIPDFLSDHTLPGVQACDRLRDHISRWTQFIAGLWVWRGRAAFALRFVARNGETRCFFVATPMASTDLPTLASELEVLFHTHRLIRHHVQAVVAESTFSQWNAFRVPVHIELAQLCQQQLWKPPNLGLFHREVQARHEQIRPHEWSNPFVLYLWRGAGGPFLLPLESLVSQTVPTALSLYLSPTVLEPHEWDWLSVMAMTAQSLGEENITAVGRGASARRVDPGAELAGHLYMANLRRLSAAPFLVLVQCTAEDNRHGAAHALAGAIQAVVQEKPLNDPDEEISRLPTGCGGYFAQNDVSGRGASQKLFAEMDLSRCVRSEALGRLPLLVDANGASTVFRLPVSVRGGVPGLAVRQFPPDFNPGARQRTTPAGHLRLGSYDGGGGAFVRVNDLTRHVLVTGFTGSGKTVTVLQIISQLFLDHRIPFLVLESAKQEYRGLLEVPAFRDSTVPLAVYTLGNELGVPFRMNPFQLLPGVRVEAHIGRLQPCFEAAVPPVGPSGSVITEALLRCYDDCGWSLTDVFPREGRARRRFPTLGSFVASVERVIDARGYRGELLDNLRAAIVGRFKPLLLGGKGRMFDVQISDPAPSSLFGTPVILEMNDLNVDDKALAVMFLLTLLREHRELDRGDGQSLRHVTVVEEAHNILAEVSPEGTGEGATKADTRFKAVEAFCAMLTEIRSLGEGILISDQSPAKIARDAMRNTNLQIAHQLRDGNDRSAMANAMIMDDEQRDFLGKLDRGHAAVFRTGLEKATFVKVDSFSSEPGDRGWGFQPLLSDEDIARHMLDRGLISTKRRMLVLPHDACRYCGAICDHRDFGFPAAAAAQTDAETWFRTRTREARGELGLTVADVWDHVVRMAVTAAKQDGHPVNVDSVWCFFIHAWHALTSDQGYKPDEIALDHDHRVELEAAFSRVTGG